jgi:hypothetical protein
MSRPWSGYTRWRTMITNIRDIITPYALFFYLQIHARKNRKGNPEWTIQRHKWHCAKTLNEETVYGLCCLTPLSTIFQLYRGEETKKTKQTYKQKQKNTIPVEKPGNETQWLALIRCNSTPQVYIYYRQLALSVEQ